MLSVVCQVIVHSVAWTLSHLTSSLLLISLLKVSLHFRCGDVSYVERDKANEVCIFNKGRWPTLFRCTKRIFVLPCHSHFLLFIALFLSVYHDLARLLDFAFLHCSFPFFFCLHRECWDVTPVLYCTVLYCTVLYCTVLYCIVLCWLYCTVLCDLRSLSFTHTDSFPFFNPLSALLHSTLLYFTLLLFSLLYPLLLYTLQYSSFLFLHFYLEFLFSSFFEAFFARFYWTVNPNI